jgi:hypothetical protein
MMLGMRITLTIDDDLMRDLRQKAHDSGLPFKEIVNKALRSDLKEIDKPRPSKPYKCKSFSLGFPPREDLDRALDLAERLDTEEIARKLSPRK